MEIKSVQVKDCEMRYFRFGTPGAKALVVLPGLSIKSVMESADSIVGVFKALGAHLDVYVMDRRSNLPATYMLDEMAEDTAAAIRALGLSDIFLYGVSQGGMMAQIIAVNHPDLVSALVLASTLDHVEPAVETMFEEWVRLAKEGKAEEVFAAFAEKIYTHDFYVKFQKIFGLLASSVSQEELARFVILAESMRGFDVSARLSEIKCPVLVLAAEGDMLLGAEPSRRIAAATGGQLYVYPGYSHAVYDEAPDFVDRLNAFFGKCSEQAV